MGSPPAPPSANEAERDEPSQGTCYGFGVRSALPFVYLRGGRSASTIDVREKDVVYDFSEEVLFERLPREDKPLHARIYADGDRFRLWIDREGWYEIDPAAGVVTVPPGIEPIRREERVWGFPAMLSFLARGDLPLHAAAVDVDGQALVFAAPGHAGKTTLATAFHIAGYRMLADDISCCRVHPGPAIVPGPAVLRVRRDSFQHLKIPRAKLTLDEPDRIHLALEDRGRGDTEPVPLRAVVFLRTDPTFRAERIDPQASLPDLWTLIFKLPTDASRAWVFEATATLASSVPVWNLHRPLEFDGLPRLVHRIIDTVLEGGE